MTRQRDEPGPEPGIDRRTLLASSGATLAGGLAGCLGVLESSTIEDDTAWIPRWNDRFVQAVQTHRIGNIAPTRQSALLNVSIYDAVNAITAARGEPHYESYLDGLDEPASDASRTAAGAAAAHEVLTRLFPADLEDLYQSAIDEAESLGGDVSAGEEWGRTVAGRAFELRSDDGEYRSGLYQACSDDPGAAGCYRGDWNAERAFVTPWTMDSRDQFRPQGPPAPDSEAYARGWQEVYEVGRDADDRPQSQVDKAVFWRGAPGSPRPPNMWLLVGSSIVRQEDLALLETARLYALLGLALADAGIAAAESKYTYGHWRPRSAIRNADADENPDTEADTDWEPLAVGGSPEYASGLASVGGAGSRVLQTVLGDDYSFEIGGDVRTGLHGDSEGVVRSFDSIGEAFEESKRSRIFLGNHFPFSVEDGGEAGQQIADWAHENYLQPVE